MSRTKVLHASQASSGGVLNALIQLANSQVENGADVHVLLCRRADTPSAARLRELFHDRVAISETPVYGMGIVAIVNLWRALLRICREVRPDFIHFHSSFAGAVGRLFTFVTRHESASFYSPHGFSFLRQDVSPLKSRIFALTERMLHTLGGTLILVSNSELAAAEREVSTRRLRVLENGINVSALPKRASTFGKVLVGTAGRVTYQKAPWIFAALANDVAALADSVWIGGGNEKSVEQWLASAPIEVSGWLSEQSALERLATIDVYVSTSLWEGLPITVIQAQSLGIPCVVSDCVGNVDVVENGVTGFIVSDTSSLIERVVQLIEDEDLRSTMGQKASERALPRFDSARLGPESLCLYNEANSTLKKD
ncbi:glycosyltransferase [Arthrobacter bambusae]|uniref:glycosyltransferase n=1 Tax=Arthrobacter bambusae TaxID=1338426 RepID=UPI002789D948|nr:glycosyltransferase [Arthrobacter bambusae]MDQ0212056.1 glycosyltransferase involved in cell wall biosynthesis [Arthrobacter bambusae]MDQ0236721.1 glycosyltransferase involved in cell wall biosynthesis [Arthrobacter bambusae]